MSTAISRWTTPPPFYDFVRRLRSECVSCGAPKSARPNASDYCTRCYNREYYHKYKGKHKEHAH